MVKKKINLERREEIFEGYREIRLLVESCSISMYPNLMHTFIPSVDLGLRWSVSIRFARFRNC